MKISHSSSQVLAVVLFLAHIWQTTWAYLPFKIPALDVKLVLLMLAAIALAGVLKLVFLIGLVICWIKENHKQEVVNLNYLSLHTHI